MIKGEKQQPGATPETSRERPAAVGSRPSGGYGMAGLAGLAIVGILSLGMLGCSAQVAGYGELTGSGSLFANMRPAAGETSRLLRNAHYYKLMGQPEVALKELELAHQQDPDNLKLVNFLAQSYEELGNFEAARKLYQEALNRNGSQPVLANNLCFNYYLEGRWQKAESCYRQTLARDPGNVAARNNLGLLYCRLGRRDEARRLWQEADGDAAADAKMGQALAALGLSGGELYAREPAPAPPAPRVTSASTPAAAVSRPPASPPSQAQTPTPPPATRPAAVRPVAAKAPAPKPTPIVSQPRKEARKLAALPAKKPPAAAPRPAPPVAAPSRQAPLTCAELVDTAIEVRNGTWTRNLAHETRSLLGQEGFYVAKIGNHIDFGATQTIIYYRPGAERVAQALGAKFFPNAELESSLKLKRGMDVKILLGADLLKRPQLMARLAGEQ
jgi:Flp pilus assembly protein TadD